MKVLIHIALKHQDGETLMDIKNISEELEVSYEHTRKIITDLIDLDIIGSKRGRGGGIYLAQDLDKIHIFDVITKVENVVEDDFKHDCANCNMPIDCKFRHMLKEQRKAFYESFRGTYLNEFMPKR